MITLKLPVEHVNVLLNALNKPMQTNTLTLANLISEIVNQVPSQTPEEEKNVE